MEINFSWFGDSGNWPEHPGKSAAVVDSTIVGPSGFLDQLETFLGLGRPKVSNVQRIAAYRRKLEQAGPNRFWDASFSIDPWSATRELLSWRDELIAAGWRPGMAASKTRFVDLAAAEVTEAVLPLGESDRLRAVIEEGAGLDS